MWIFKSWFIIWLSIAFWNPRNLKHDIQNIMLNKLIHEVIKNHWGQRHLDVLIGFRPWLMLTDLSLTQGTCIRQLSTWKFKQTNKHKHHLYTVCQSSQVRNDTAIKHIVDLRKFEISKNSFYKNDPTVIEIIFYYFWEKKIYAGSLFWTISTKEGRYYTLFSIWLVFGLYFKIN